MSTQDTDSKYAMNSPSSSWAYTKYLLLSLLLSTLSLAQVPDLTNGGVIRTDDPTRWTLGPTGLKGWMYSNKHSDLARQIAITEVENGSPASGRINIADVIIGLGNTNFSSDARIALAQAIQDAEAGANNGILKLKIWRNGTIITKDIPLQVIGAYSTTAPFNCPKSNLIFEKGCEKIFQAGLTYSHTPNSYNALCLLASGKQQYMPALAAYASTVSNYVSTGNQTWNYAQALIFLSEYKLATNDLSLLPGLTRMALELAKGQSDVGTWGHGFANKFGMPSGYGTLNMAGTQAALGLALAKVAGVNHPEVNTAIDKASDFFSKYYKRGSVTYGDHVPWTEHSTNGKTAVTAMFYDILRDSKHTEFFAKMTAAGYQEIDITYSTNYFRHLWNMMAQSRCGTEMTIACWKKQSWYYDLARKWDGTFDYQPGAKETAEYFTQTTGWNNTGSFLLTYAIPLKSLYITGKIPSSFNPLNSTQVAEVIKAGQGYFDNVISDPGHYSKRTDQELLNNLSSWSPILHLRSAKEIKRRSANLYPQILTLLNSPAEDTKLGAIVAASIANGSDAQKQQAIAKFQSFLTDPSLPVRVTAIKALREIGPLAKIAIPDLIARLRIPTNPAADPMGIEHRAISDALFSRNHAETQGLITRRDAMLNDVDRASLWEAIEIGIKNDHGFTRAHYHHMFNELSLNELSPVHSAIKEGITNTAQTGVVGVSTFKLEGIKMLTNNLVDDGMDLIVDYARFQRKHASERRLPLVMDELKKYGIHAKRLIPQLEVLADYFFNEEHLEEEFPHKPLSHGKAAYVRETIEFIKNTTLNPTLLTLDRPGDRQYTDWITNYTMPATSRGSEMDPDADGKSNLMEQFLGTTPNIADNPKSLNLVLVPTAGNNRRYQATHHEGATLTSDISAKYQWSADLTNYQDAGITRNGTSVSFTKQLNTPSPGLTTVTINVNGTIPPNLFVRLKIKQNTP